MSRIISHSRGIIILRRNSEHVKFTRKHASHQQTQSVPLKSACRGISSDVRFNSLFDRTIVTCLPGLESVLSAELTMLGVQHHAPESSRTKKKNGKIELQTLPNADDIFRCCLYLGTATQVRLRCASFDARGLPELKRKAARIPWTKILKADTIENGNLDVRVLSTKSKLYHTGAIRDRVFQAISQHFGMDENYFGNEENVQKKCDSDAFPTVQLDVSLLEDQVEISINSYSTPLHQRGYRKQVAKAPLREDLAYAILFTAGWMPAWTLDDNEKRTGNTTLWQGLVDPFCGSGTIAIEGAAMMLGLAPGRFRNGSPFQGTVLEDNQKWSTILRSSLETAESSHPNSFSISASDRDLGAIKTTKANAKRAGVLDALTIESAPLSGQRWFEKPLESPSSFLVVTNPPYGKRISSRSSTRGLRTLYQSLGHSIQRVVREHERRLCGVVLTNNPDLLTRSGVSFPFKTSFKTFHGGLKVSAMKFDASNLLS